MYYLRAFHGGMFETNVYLYSSSAFVHLYQMTNTFAHSFSISHDHWTTAQAYHAAM